MSRTKALISILTVLILIALSGASVWAAPNLQESIGGEVQEIVIEVDEETGATTVLVTLLVDETTGETQPVRLSLETAIALGLVEVDTEGNPIVNEDTIGKTVEINPNDVIEEDEEEDEEEEEEGEEPLTEHPVASALVKYFADTLGLDYDAVMGYHEEDGMGFGVIAQACWISFLANNDDGLLDQIIKAKKGEIEFSSITLPDGTTPKNWGQFKKAALGNEKAKKNLGAIMSGRAAGEQEQEMSATGLSGKGKDKGGKPDTPPGQLKNKKDKDKGGGPPAEPPGQVKNKDKGGGKKE